MAARISGVTRHRRHQESRPVAATKDGTHAVDFEPLRGVGVAGGEVRIGFDETPFLERGSPRGVKGTQNALGVGEPQPKAGAGAFHNQPAERIGAFERMSQPQPAPSGHPPEDPGPNPELPSDRLQVIHHRLERVAPLPGRRGRRLANPTRVDTDSAGLSGLPQELDGALGENAGGCAAQRIGSPGSTGPPVNTANTPVEISTSRRSTGVFKS